MTSFHSDAAADRWAEANAKRMTSEQIKQLVQDNTDMRNAHQTSFRRCSCGRIAERGIICPTVQEGGNCKTGE